MMMLKIELDIDRSLHQYCPPMLIKECIQYRHVCVYPSVCQSNYLSVSPSVLYNSNELL